MSLPSIATPHWQGAAQGELRLPHCRVCDHRWYPPARRCPNCLSDDIDWDAVSGRGTVRGWTVFHRPYFASLAVPVPYAVIHVALDAGPELYANAEDPTQPLAVGTLVEPVFVPAGEREALVRFKPVTP